MTVEQAEFEGIKGRQNKTTERIIKCLPPFFSYPPICFFFSFTKGKSFLFLFYKQKGQVNN